MYLAKRKYYNNIRFLNYASYFLHEVDSVYLRVTEYGVYSSNETAVTVPNRLLNGSNPDGIHSKKAVFFCGERLILNPAYLWLVYFFK